MTNSDDGGRPVRVTAVTLSRILRAPRSLVDHMLLAIALGPPRAHHPTRGEAPEPKWRSRARERRRQTGRSVARVEQRPRPG